MEKLSLTHEGWYALPQWERDTWIARVMYQDQEWRKLYDSMIDKGKRQLKSPYLGSTAYWLLGQMV